MWNKEARVSNSFPNTLEDDTSLSKGVDLFIVIVRGSFPLRASVNLEYYKLF